MAQTPQTQTKPIKPDPAFLEWFPRAFQCAVLLKGPDSIKAAIAKHSDGALYLVVWQSPLDQEYWLIACLEDTSESVAIAALEDDPKYGPLICREFSVREEAGRPWVSTTGSAAMAERYLNFRPGRWLVTECDWCRLGGSAFEDIVQFTTEES